MIDGIAASLALTFLLTGWETGTVYQLGQAVAVFMAALIARAITYPLALFLIDLDKADGPDHAIGLAFLGAFLTVFAILWFSVLRLTAEMRRFHARNPGDRVVGGAVGALRGGLMGLVIAVGILSYTFDRPNDTPYAAFERSHVGAFAMQYNFLSSFADKLDEALTERSEGPSPSERAWDLPK